MIRLVLCCVLVAGGTACGEDASPPEPTAALRDLCEGIDSSVDQAQQERAFFDRAHDALHRLAERVTKEHPDVAAELLEAKQRVEANLRRAKKAVPTESFRELIQAVDRALAEVDAPELRCGPE